MSRVPEEIRNMTNGMLWCRRMHFHPFELIEEHDTYEFYRCPSCGTEKTEQLNQWTGALVGRWYKYPEGWRLTRDLMVMDYFRLEALRRRRADERKDARA